MSLDGHKLEVPRSSELGIPHAADCCPFIWEFKASIAPAIRLIRAPLPSCSRFARISAQAAGVADVSAWIPVSTVAPKVIAVGYLCGPWRV